MKKFSKIGKRVLAFFLVALMNINTYAAVGANDGSAFVTKAEFDALIDTFNGQMDTYQSGLNTKIDGAVANYLAGLSSQSRKKMDIYNNGWSVLSCINGVQDPTFNYPNIDILYGGNYKGYFGWESGWKNYTLGFDIRYSYAKDNKVTRAIVSHNKSESAQTASDVKVYWKGVTNEYIESYSINAGLNESKTADLYGIEGSGSKQITLENGLSLIISNGYQASIKSATTVVNPTVKYLYNGSNSTTLSFSNKTLNTVAEVSYGKLIDYLTHIVQYAGDTAWNVSNPSFTKTFRTHSNNTYNSVGILSATNKAAHGSVTCWAAGGSGSSTNFSFRHDTTSQKVYPSIGMLANDLKANQMIQFEDEISYKVGSKSGTISDVKLNQGMVLLAAEKDTKIEWAPRFTKGKVWDATNKKWIDSTASRVKLLFSLGEFSDKIASTEIIKADSSVGTTTDGGVLCNVCLTSTDEATVVSFTMPKDGVVYAKWVPDTSDYDTAKWIQPIDLTQSNTYISITE